MSAFANQLKYHQEVFLPNLRLLVEQQLRGIYVDQEALHACHADLLLRIQSSMTAFLEHPDVAHHISEYNKEVHSAWKRAEPTKFNKDGTVAKRWEKWAAKEETWVAENGFNPNSKTQLRRLFFNQLGHKPVLLTDSGLPAVSRKALPALGEPGKLLSKYNLYVKRRGYVEAMIAKTTRDGLLHPQFNSYGTMTGRLGGSGGLNMQQMPKVASFLHCLRARPGHRLVQLDAEALEPTILTEFSRDPAMWKIYGPGAKPNDLYLFVGSKLASIGKEIRKYYDPDNPTPEGIALAKKHCKRERDISKVICLSSSYGAGPAKIHETLKLAGIDISMSEVRNIHRDYWRLFAGTKRFEESLKDIWAANEGWIPSVMGTPICIAEPLLKDIVNRFCLTGDSLVLTDSGPKPLVSVTTSDLVWDGVEWVSHEGVQYMGTKQVINLSGINLTPDHKVLTENGWTRADRVDSLAEVPGPRVGWKEVWRLCYSIGKTVAKKWLHVRGSRMQPRYAPDQPI